MDAPTKHQTIRVQVIISMDVDIDAYRAEYGDDTASVADIRKDVQWSAFNAVDQVTFPEGSGIVRNTQLLNAAK